MATLKLNKKPARPGDRSKPGEERRAPLRGKGVSRPRQTLAEAQAERNERQAAYEQRQQQDGPRGDRAARPGGREDPRRDPRNDPRRGPGRGEPGAGRGAPRQGGFQRDEGPRFEERRPPRRPEGGPAPRGGRDDRGPRGHEGGGRGGPGDRYALDERGPRGDSRGPQGGEWRGGSQGGPQGGPRSATRPDQRFDQRSDPRAGPRQGGRDERGPYEQRGPRGEFQERGRGGFSGPRGDAQQRGPGADPRPSPRQDQRRNTGPRPDAERRPYPGAAARPLAQPARPATRSHDDDDDDEDFRDPSAEGERLSKRMGVLGMASRREADEWIAAGWVKVDGKLAVLGQRVGPEAKIEIDQLAHKQQAKQATILLHKPIGYVSGQAEDGYEPASVLVRSGNHWSEDTSGIKYHIGHSRGLAPAGRLDIDSTGLLVLTQDGRIAKLLIGEDSQIEKEYLVRVEFDGQGAPMKDFPAQDLARLNHGLELDGVQLKPAKVSWINDDQLRFVLREGRKRQIRRMCEQVGLKVVGLKRVRIGRINLGNLPVGQWRFLTPWERFD